MAEATIRARIKTVLESVSNVGLVYDYMRLPGGIEFTWSKFIDLFTTTINSQKVIRGWSITCTRLSPVSITAMGSAGSDTEITYRYVLHGWFGFKDADESEKAAIAVVEAVVIALNGDSTLRAYFGTGPKPLASCEYFDTLPFGDALCHYAQIILPIQERDTS